MAFGSHHLYVMLHSSRLALKIGRSSSLNRRIADHTRRYGEFCTGDSFVLRTDDEQEARTIETSIKHLAADFHLPLPSEWRGRGETEWFLAECYEELRTTIEQIATIRHGEGFHVSALPRTSTVRLNANHRQSAKTFSDFLLARASEMKQRLENLRNTRSFRVAVQQLIPHLIGVARIGQKDNAEFEIFLRPNQERHLALDKLLENARLTAGDDDSWAGADLCTSLDGNCNFQRAHIHFGSLPSILKENWQSRGFAARLHALVEDLADNYPLPPGYDEFVGVSSWDLMDEKTREVLAQQLGEALFGDLLPHIPSTIR